MAAGFVFELFIPDFDKFSFFFDFFDFVQQLRTICSRDKTMKKPQPTISSAIGYSIS